jgi:outer membrane immunogenic protein
VKKLLVLGTVAAAFFVAPAFAADMGVKAPPPPPPAPAFSWTGFYVGANGGYGWRDPTVTYTPNDPGAFIGTCAGIGGGTCIPPASFSIGGGLVGGQVGYNWQYSQKWLAGVEADLDWSRINGSGNSNFSLNSAGPGTFTATESVSGFGTLRGRLGFIPVSPLLIYATGGLAFGDVKASAIMPGSGVGVGGANAGGFAYACGTGTGQANCFIGSSSRTMVGWTVGAGFEYAIMNNTSLKAEYLYADLGSRSINTVTTSTFI